MSEFRLDTFCGIYCGACSILMSYRTGEKDQLALFFNEENVRAFLAAQGEKYPEGEPFEHKCTGCKTSTLFINCRPCKIRKCAMEKGLEHCIECAEYPCEILKFFMCNQEVQQKLPHTKVPLKNLERIKEIGVARWLVEQERIWQCPDCGLNSSWYAGTCSQCGRDLNSIKDYNQL
jgi:hypothetical protein